MTRFLNAPLDASDVFNDIHDTVGFLYGVGSDIHVYMYVHCLLLTYATK